MIFESKILPMQDKMKLLQFNIEEIKEEGLEAEIAQAMRNEIKHSSVPHKKESRALEPKENAKEVHLTSPPTVNEELEIDLPATLNLLSQQLKVFIEESNKEILKKEDFERKEPLTTPSDSLNNADDEIKQDKDQLQTEGRAFYLKIAAKKNWPPTIEDLLEHINIYSQINNMKFTSLNLKEFCTKGLRPKSKISNYSSSKAWKMAQYSSVGHKKKPSTFRQETIENERHLSRAKNT